MSSLVLNSTEAIKLLDQHGFSTLDILDWETRERIGDDNCEAVFKGRCQGLYG